ncbi:unnamed protein product [Effrenium voratum]|nr:unnamed protein product [Effrenium voratum]
MRAISIVLFVQSVAGEADCPAKQEQAESSLLQLHTSCTPEYHDPYESSSRVECCSGLEMCLGDNGGYWSYTCKKSCVTSCAAFGEDVWATGQQLPCCEGLRECSGEWNMDGHWSNKCFKQCAMGQYNPHFDTTPDYLNIAATAAGVKGNPGSISDNYYLVIGDGGGCDGGCDGCCDYQMQVAAKMIQYVKDREAKNPNSKLLFILVVGDNFYWTGVKSGRFESTWKKPYGELAEKYPWFVVLGNHDFGNDDPQCLCPFFNPRLECSTPGGNTENGCGGAEPYSNTTQTYACNQLNADKGGVDGDLRKNYHIPDFTFYYTIPELDFEMIAMDYNIYDFEGIGGNGYGETGGAREVAKFCGGTERVKDSLSRLRAASDKVMQERAAAASSKNVAIFSHYPDWAQEGINLRQKFLEQVDNRNKTGMRVLNFYGHTHIQQCDRTAEEGYAGCTDFLTGGAGGCCGDLPAGFTAITFDSHGKQVTECFLQGDCTLYRWAGAHFQLKASSNDDVCPHTVDDPRCPAYKGPVKFQA